jgi:hypothetical protein
MKTQADPRTTLTALAFLLTLAAADPIAVTAEQVPEPRVENRMVDVDGLPMRVQTAGWEHRDMGQPIVVFENGAGTPVDAWEPVLAAVAADAQDVLRALYRDRVGPAFRAADNRYRRAFGEHLRMVPVDARAIGYGYREAPDLIEPYIREFLDEVQRREGR